MTKNEFIKINERIEFSEEQGLSIPAFQIFQIFLLRMKIVNFDTSRTEYGTISVYFLVKAYSQAFTASLTPPALSTPAFQAPPPTGDRSSIYFPFV